MYNEAIINYGSISNNTFRRGIVQGSPSSLKAGRKRQVRSLLANKMAGGSKLHGLLYLGGSCAGLSLLWPDAITVFGRLNAISVRPVSEPFVLLELLIVPNES